MNGIWAKSEATISEVLSTVRPQPQANGFLCASLAKGFEHISRTFPDRIAAACGQHQITYEELNRSANRIAHGLVANHVQQPGQIVAIYLDRSIAVLSAMLGVIKAGFAYLPIDPTYPLTRVTETIQDAAPVAVITNERLAQGLSSIQTSILLHNAIDTGREDLNLEPDTAASSLAYVMYTSGSTGKPKGVLVTHGNVLRLFSATDPWFHFNQHDVWTMFHSFAFDFSVWEIWGPLLTGGKLVIVPFEISRSTEEFYALLSQQCVTVLNQTPSAFSLIDQVEEAGPALPLALRYVIFGGEALQYRALRNWFKRHGDVSPQLINMYGITETTVHVTYRAVTETDAHSETDSTIGEPIPDLQLYVLDGDLKPVPDGEEGELCVGGAGVAGGYLNRPELTAQRFVPDPFVGSESSLYRSGDMARRRTDGQLVYLGRNDNQVKINGFRIELGEVEAALAEYPGIRQVSVIARADHTGRQRLAAYFVADGGLSVAAHTLREFLLPRAPAQMIPAFYVQMDAIPLTHNGKVDLKSLPTPVTGSTAPVTAIGTPMQERVAAIWRDILGAENIGLDDNFFDIGGSSILLIRVRTELQTQLDRTIPITWMFEFTSIRALADKLREDSGAAESKAVSGGAVSPAQRQTEDQARKQREAFARMRSMKGGRA